LGLAIWGSISNPAWLMLAGFIAFMRCLVWLSFRFPLTMLFLVSFLSGLMRGGRGRRW
jgi:hypothetical protein